VHKKAAEQAAAFVTYKALENETPRAISGVSFCMQKSISWQATGNLTLASD